MTLTLYRVTLAGDTLSGAQPVSAIEKIIFNSGTDVNSHAGFITSIEVSNTTGIGNNQAAEQDLGDHQDLGSVEQIYTLTGFIAKRTESPATTNLITIMKKFDDEVKTNTAFVHGRFGVYIDDFIQYNVVPDGTGSNQVGLIWKSLKWGPLGFDRLPLAADFVITLIVDKGDDQ